MKKHPLWLFILLPAITMLLGWGLRGFIGGGPFGAMIPGAMVMLVICMLLDIPASNAAVMVVFGTAGIAMGGEMTYGQTLGFLRHPETVWWGTCGTTVKGGVWGLVGGTFIGLGIVYKRIPVKIIYIGFLLFLVAFIIGLKLINDPKVIYFSDPINKPRQESWAGLLFAAIALQTWLKVKLNRETFTPVFRFAWYGMAGGALGFGLGAFWLVLGSRIGNNSWINEWWKLMEFSFGFIMGGFLGYAAWLSRPAIKMTATVDISLSRQLLMLLVIASIIFGLLPLLEPFIEAADTGDGAMTSTLRTGARVLVNYTFIGIFLIMAAMRWPFIAFQLAVTLTFSHTVLDLVDDLGDKNITVFSPAVRLMIVLITSAIVSFLVALYQRKQTVLKSMFLILVWSTVLVAVVRMMAYSQFQRKPGKSLLQFVVGDLLVFNFFIAAAVIVSFWTLRRMITNKEGRFANS